MSSELVNVPHIDDSDSGFSDGCESLESLDPELYEHITENGRTYHRHCAGLWPFPNDEREVHRMDIEHELHKYAQRGRLYFSPLQTTQIHQILDVGTGSGTWASEIALTMKNSSVLGTDLSPIQPTDIPPTLEFQIDNAAECWSYGERFDFVYARNLWGLVDNTHIIKQAFLSSKPGGWVEVVEMLPWDVKKSGKATQQWCKLIGVALGRTQPCYSNQPKPARLKTLMENSGLVRVQYCTFKVPCNSWSRTRHLKKLGSLNAMNIMEGLEAFTMALFTRRLGWTSQEVQVYLIGVRREFHDRKIHSYMELHIIWGQKPTDC